MTRNNSLNCGNVSISTLVLSSYQTNVYVVSNDQGAFVVDPADDCARIMDAIRTVAGGKIDAIVVTHEHSDHIGALAQLRHETDAPVIASAIDAPLIEKQQKQAAAKLSPVQNKVVDRTVKEGDIVELCGMKWKVLITPGHTKGSMCLYLPASENGEERGILFSGDTLFCGAFGRTDFPGGSMNEMVKSLKRLDTLPADTLVFPGHMQFTEIGEEQRGILRRIG